MKIGTVIRKYRKKLGITQEEMANRLGITTPAVNKWENDNTLPDVTLLAPIARLLGITTDELLSFKEDLTTEEINNFTLQLQKDLREKDFETVFLLAKSKIEEYPNCGMLILSIANALDIWPVMNRINIPNKEYYDDIILEWYERCLKSDDEKVRGVASEFLFNKYYYMKQDYEMALKYVKNVYCENTLSKFMEALVYSKTNKKDEAYKILEELLFKKYTGIQLILSYLCEFYMEDNDNYMANKLADVASSIATTLEFGVQTTTSLKLSVATWEKNVAKTEQLMRRTLDNLGKTYDFTTSDLYKHTELNNIGVDMKKDLGLDIKSMKKTFIASCKDKKYDYMKGNEWWENLTSSDS